MVRTGPDGALWIVDMYRYMIEHPDWLPEEGRTELLPHYRAGDEKGRIYRVTPAEQPAREPAWPEALSTEQLVASLESPNGWLRDKVHQLLLWRGDARVTPLLERLVNSSPEPRARLHALCVLDGLGTLQSELIRRALNDSHPGMRENALRLAESRGTPGIIEAAIRLVDDPDPKVRLQLAFTLGEWTRGTAGEALAILAMRSSEEPHLVAAVMSSAVPHLESLIEGVTAFAEPCPEPLFSSLLQLALGMGRTSELRRLLAPVLTPVGGTFNASQVRALNRFLDVLSRRGMSVETFLEKPEDPLGRLLAPWRDVTIAAAQIARDSDAPAMDRIEAARLIMRDDTLFAMARRVLAEHLTPRQSHEIQLAAVAALGSTGKREVTPVLLGGWDGYAPRIRSAVLETLARRSVWALDLLDRVATGDIQRNAFDAPSRSRLLHHGDKEVRAHASAVFESGMAPTREAVRETFRPALALSGDPHRGADLYNRLCVTCHVRGNSGNPVGPDLLSVVHHPPEKLLVSILDPNQEVQPGFQAFNCTLSSGEELFGVIAAETANSVVLKLADGSSRTVSRQEIAELRGGHLSLMPEGLEAGLQPQDMADLIAFLRTP
jgi:putative heme-binding domain-containing protein